jgi:transposase
MAKWFQKNEIEFVVMESTGSFWIPVYDILEEYGFTIHLVNARDAKSCPGRRKTDKNDCKWLQKLGTYGLLTPSFIAPSAVRQLQVYMHQRDSLTKNASTYIQRVQKTLVEMNLFLHNAISDITGKSGMLILNAIINGETDPQKLVKLCDRRIKSSRQIIINSLTGNYREEGVFVISQNLKMYEICQAQIIECENRYISLLEKFESKVNIPEMKETKKFPTKNLLHRVLGIDLTAVPGLKELTIQKVLAKTGTNLSPWKTHKHFTSWLGLAPNREISGGKKGKIIRKKMTNSATLAFKMAAFSLQRSECYLGAFYRKMKSRFGPRKATAVTARKLAEIFFHMVTRGTEFQEYGVKRFEKEHKEQTMKNLKRKAKVLGFELIPATV